ncbi:ATP-binding protein [Campylobacter sp. faydin G-24]|uniref:ATP-binding protein n=1 Tax=Campylobacter anatolicus TaxID=2829105 RepID=A0ABS5HIE7_9BACT|nr:ATP-binding protein [Campylobacter anatolicus]MBR8464049.1 ATP-binding protein [Campylobacter anatolicus]
MSKINAYTNIKDIFINEDDIESFVNLDQSMSCYNKLISAMQKPLKLILFYGRPGSGKTFLLNKIVNDLSGNKNVIFFSYPFFKESSFIAALSEKLLSNGEKFDNFEEFISFYSLNFKDKNLIKNQAIIILDEAQLYPNELIEKIRLMADTRYFKFLFTIHKTNDEDVLAKDYFTTRIWESIELKSINKSEITLYIQKKLEQKEYEKYLNFSDADYALAYDFCGGNLRNLNKLMYKFFEICEYYDEHRPSALYNQNEKILTMAALETELINA